MRRRRFPPLCATWPRWLLRFLRNQRWRSCGTPLGENQTRTPLSDAPSDAKAVAFWQSLTPRPTFTNAESTNLLSMCRARPIDTSELAAPRPCERGELGGAHWQRARRRPMGATMAVGFDADWSQHFFPALEQGGAGSADILKHYLARMQPWRATPTSIHRPPGHRSPRAARVPPTAVALGRRGTR